MQILHCLIDDTDTIKLDSLEVEQADATFIILTLKRVKLRLIITVPLDWL